MGEQANGSCESRLGLAEEYEQRFRHLEQIPQEQIVYDAWRRALQDWRHERADDWEALGVRDVHSRRIELKGWEADSINAGVPELGELVLQCDGVFEEVDGAVKEQFLQDVRDHMEEIIQHRYTAEE